MKNMCKRTFSYILILMLLISIFMPQEGFAVGGGKVAEIRQDNTGAWYVDFQVHGTTATSGITYETIGWDVKVEFEDGSNPSGFYEYSLAGQTEDIPFHRPVTEIFEAIGIPDSKFKLGGTMYLDAVQVIKKGDDVISPKYRGDVNNIISGINDVAGVSWDPQTITDLGGYYGINGHFEAINVTSEFTIIEEQYENMPLDYKNNSYPTGCSLGNYTLEIQQDGTTIKTFTDETQAENYLDDGLPVGKYKIIQTVDNYDGDLVDSEDDIIYDWNDTYTYVTIKPLETEVDEETGELIITPIEKVPSKAGLNESYTVTGEKSMPAEKIVGYRHQRSVGNMNNWVNISSSMSFTDSSASEGKIYYRVMVKDTEGNWSDWSNPDVIEITDNTPTSVNAELEMPDTVYEGVSVYINTRDSRVKYGSETMLPGEADERGIADYDFDFSCDKHGNLDANGGSAYFEELGYQTAEYELETSMDYDNDTEVFRVIATPHITRVLKGQRKVNRKLTVDFNSDIFHEDYPMNTNNSYVRVIDLQNGQTAIFNNSKSNTTYIKGRAFADNEISFIIKQTGNYKVIKYVEDTRGHSDTEEITITIEEDTPPVAQLDLLDEYYREETGTASINIKKEGYSPDIDLFQTNALYYRIDTDNDSTFSDETWHNFSTSKSEYSKIFTHNKVGKIQFRYIVRETYDTLPEYITYSIDYLIDTYYKTIEIENYAPYTSLEFMEKYGVDLKVVGDVTETVNNKTTNMVNNITDERAVLFNTMESDEIDIKDTSTLEIIKEFDDYSAGYRWGAYEVIASTDEVGLYRRYTTEEALSYGRYDFDDPEYVGRDLKTGQIRYILDPAEHPELERIIYSDIDYQTSFDLNNLGEITWDVRESIDENSVYVDYKINVNTGEIVRIGNINYENLSIMENTDIGLDEDYYIKNISIIGQHDLYTCGKGRVYQEMVAVDKYRYDVYYVVNNKTGNCVCYKINEDFLDSDSDLKYIGCFGDSIYFYTKERNQLDSAYSTRQPTAKGSAGHIIYKLDKNGLSEFTSTVKTQWYICRSERRSRYAYYATPYIEDQSRVSILDDGSLIIYECLGDDYYDSDSDYKFEKTYLIKVDNTGNITRTILLYSEILNAYNDDGNWRLPRDDDGHLIADIYDEPDYPRMNDDQDSYCSLEYETEGKVYLEFKRNSGSYYYLVLNKHNLDLAEPEGEIRLNGDILDYKNNWQEELLKLYDETGYIYESYENEEDYYRFNNQKNKAMTPLRDDGWGMFLPVKNNDKYFVFIMGREYYSFPNSDYRADMICVAEKETGNIYYIDADGWDDCESFDSFYKDGKIYTSTFIGHTSKMPTFDTETKTFSNGIIDNPLNIASNDGSYVLSMWPDNDDNQEEIKIYKATDTLKKLKDYIDEYTENDLKYMAVVENNSLTYNQDYIDEVAQAFNNAGVSIIWIGKSGNQSTGQALANATGGLYINNSGLSSSFNTLQNHILHELPEIEASTVIYKAKGEQIEYDKNYLDLENDPIYTPAGEQWRYTMDTSKPHPDGVPSWSGVWRSSSFNSINYTGEYDVEYRVKDNPAGTDNRFNSYRKWSNPKSARLVITENKFLEAVLVLDPAYPKPVAPGGTLYVTVVTTSSEVPDKVEAWIQGGSKIQLSKASISGNNARWEGTYTVPSSYNGDYTFYARAYMDDLTANDNKLVKVYVNRPPTVDLNNLNPSSPILEGNDVSMDINTNDLDSDDLSLNIRVYKDSTLISQENRTVISPYNTIDYVLQQPVPGSYRVRAYVTDEEGAADVDNIYFTVEKANQAPAVTLTNLRPSFIYEGDDVNVDINMNDPDNDDLTMNVKIYKNGNLYSNDSQNVTRANYTLDYRLLDDATTGNYTVNVTVTDPEGETDIDSINFTVNELDITGQVKHTDKWNENRINYNQYKTGTDNNPRAYNTFWSCEAFVLSAETTEIDPESDVTANRVTCKILSESYSDTLSSSNNEDWEGEIRDSEYINEWGMDDPETLTFRFTVTYSNGKVKTDDIDITVDNREDYYRLHKIF